MRITIDPNRCQGHALCGLTAPDLFVIDEETGHASVRSESVPAELEALAERAVAGCPEQAIAMHYTVR
jgi:ferredoxin